MAMTWTSLTAAKGVAGSVATWVSYTKLDTETIVDEAQALLWSLLRTREMRTELSFSMPVGGAELALPTGFLDPIGRIYMTSFNNSVRHKDQGEVQRNRIYTENNGTLAANPFTTVTNSNTVTVALVNHNLNQDSVFSCSGATTFNGVTINGTFPVTSIIDANDFTVDVTSLGTTPSGSGPGGGSAVSYLADSLVVGMPYIFGIWNEKIYFDQAFSQQCLCKLDYYQSLPLLSANNQTNFLTSRYPQLMRRACVTMAADFMKDTEEYNKDLTALQAVVAQVNVENDMSMRGMEIDTEVP